MSKKADLMGLGMQPFLADRLADAAEVNTFTAQGSSVGSALAIGGSQYLVAVTATNGGAGVVLPSVGGANGALIGDDFIIANFISASVTVYAPSAATISSAGALTNGTTGVSVSANKATSFYALTSTTWIGQTG